MKGTRPWSIVTSLVLAGLIAVPALADATWNGPGWYVAATETGLDTEYISGPYATEVACNAAKPADTQSQVYACLYLSTQPGSGGDGPP